MIHTDKDQFLTVLESASAVTGFPMGLLEKDYYLTMLLCGINEELDENLIFKGGTCLNKMYFEYFRLSEDLDFTLLLPDGRITKAVRSRRMDKIKQNIGKHAAKYGLALDGSERPGRDESRQYVYHIDYNSIITGNSGHIKLEIGLRANPHLPAKKMKIKHVFKNPFSGADLFETGTVKCLTLVEIAAEKFRAASTRRRIAPRDFFDLDYLINKGFDFKSAEFHDLVSKKLLEDGFEGPVKKYYANLNRTVDELESMKSRLSDELYPVLTPNAAGNFDLERVLKYFNSL